MTTVVEHRGFDYSLVDKVVERIVEDFSPRKIIIFGSVARHEASSNSDIDILVVMEPIRIGKYPPSTPIHHSTKTAHVPKNIMVILPSEYEIERNDEGSFISIIDETEYVAYEA